MSREMTPEELAELISRLKDNPSLATLKEAVAAAKPARKPKVPKVPKREPTALQRLKQEADAADAQAARVRVIRLELEEIRRIPVGDLQARAEGSLRSIRLNSELNVAFCNLADTAEYLYRRLRAELDKLPDHELITNDTNEPTP